jgi:NitT/TauT family transport system substrate-binding protein
MNRVRGTALLCASVLSFLLAGCGGGTPAAQKAADSGEIIAYGELDPQVSGQQIIAEKMGYFKDEGLTIKNKLMNGPDENASLVASGDAKICFGSIYNNISVAANGVKVKVVAPLANAAGTQSVVARKGLVIKSAKDLEGKKIGMTNGAGVLIAIRNMCNATGTDISKIQFVNLQVSDQLAALEKGDIDAMAAWEPWVGKAVDQGGTLLFSGTKANLPGVPNDVHWIDFYMTLQVTDDFYKDHPETIEKLLRALHKATTYINEHPEDAAKIIAKRININEAECLRIMKKNVYSMTFDQQFVDGADNMANFMLDMKSIKAIPKTESYMDTTLLKKVFPEDVTIK